MQMVHTHTRIGTPASLLHAAFDPDLCCPLLPPWRPASGAASAKEAAEAEAGAATRNAGKKNKQRSWLKSKLQSAPARQRELVSEDLAQEKELEADQQTPQHKAADRRAKKSARRRELASEDLAQEKELEADHQTPQHKAADRRAKKSARRRELASEDLAQEKAAGQGIRRK